MNNPQQRNEIVALYRRFGGDIVKVAKELGIRPHDVRREITPVTVATLPEYIGDQPQPTRDRKGHLILGRPELRPWIVSYRHALGPWPEADRKKLAAARQAYDAGTHVMVQGRDGCWIIQYLWKRDRPVSPPNWFYGAVA